MGRLGVSRGGDGGDTAQQCVRVCVLRWSECFEVVRVDAGGSLADVVDVHPSRDGSVQFDVDGSVKLFLDAADRDLGVGVGVGSVDPASVRVDRYFAGEAADPVALLVERSALVGDAEGAPVGSSVRHISTSRAGRTPGRANVAGVFSVGGLDPFGEAEDSLVGVRRHI